MFSSGEASSNELKLQYFNTLFSSLNFILSRLKIHFSVLDDWLCFTYFLQNKNNTKEHCLLYSKISYHFILFFDLCTLYVVIKSLVNCLIDYISLQAVKLLHFCVALKSTNTIRIIYRISRVVIDVS